MVGIDWIVNYRRYLKRRNYSSHTVKMYLHAIRGFVLWLDVAVEEASYGNVLRYIDHLLDRGLKATAINFHVVGIRQFYDYLGREEGVELTNPVKGGCRLRVPKPLPRALRDEQVSKFLAEVKKRRDRAMFMLMLRCGLRVEEVAKLTLGALDLARGSILVQHGKGGKGRVVYISRDAFDALAQYLKARGSSRVKEIFLVEKGPCNGQPISVRGIQKRMEYYARKAGLRASCHQLRLTMATQLLNADAEIVTIQDLLGHSRISTTQRYCRVSNLKVQRDYFKAMDLLMERTAPDR
jgi:site-specific recombinase XerD